MNVKLIIFVLLFIGVFCDENEPEVKTKQGLVKGKTMKSRKSQTFFAFLGIPYAEPPVGELRFKDPIPVKNWKEVKNCQNDSPMCIQKFPFTKNSVPIEGKEDCLYLNVYTPNVKVKDTKYAVMVFIHGGGWMSESGSSTLYGPGHLLDYGIVLVTMNYRLGAFGFLSTGDDNIPGNFGLKDQTLALKWVKENIEKFGGDPNNVTIFGSSAGGASVHLHMMSPLSRGLFNRGISQSGTALCPWAFGNKQESEANLNKIANILNCHTENSRQLVECLRAKSAEEIVNTYESFMYWGHDPMIPLKPIVEHNYEGAFLTKHPVDYIMEGETSHIPWITGMTSDEGAMRCSTMFANPQNIADLNSRFEELIPISLQYNYTTKDKNQVTRNIKEFYFHNEIIDEKKIQQVINLYTDAWALSCMAQSIHLQNTSKSLGEVYVYYLAYRGSLSFVQYYGNTTRNYGVCHGDELIYLFQYGKFNYSVFSDVDLKILDVIVTLWTNFAKTGKPSQSKDDCFKTQWHPVGSENFEYLHIRSENIKTERPLLQERIKFWSSLLIDDHRQKLILSHMKNN